MDTQQIIDLNHEFTFFTWSVQSQVQPLTAVRASKVQRQAAAGALLVFILRQGQAARAE